MFTFAYSEWDGIYTDNTMGVEYRAFDKIEFGLGIGSNSLKVVEETNDYRFTYDNRIVGAVFYVAGYF